MIKEEFYALAFEESRRDDSHLDIANKAIELQHAAEANAEQEQPLISAEEAWKLGACKAEWRWSESEAWSTISAPADDFQYSPMAQYRAIKQPEPAEPHAELKAMYEQQVMKLAKFGAMVIESQEFITELAFKAGVLEANPESGGYRYTISQSEIKELLK